MENNFAYVEIVLSEKSKKILNKILGNIVSKDQFYYSDVVSRIQGDVTGKAHLTLFYGLKKEVLKDEKLKQFIDNIKIKNLTLGNVILLEGYQELYKVLCIEVKDEDKELELLSKKLLEFEHDDELGKREFKPHVTLAYVVKDYVLPTDYNIVDNQLFVDRIELKS